MPRAVYRILFILLLFSVAETDHAYAQAAQSAPDTSLVEVDRGAFGTVTEFIVDLFDISTKNVQDKALRILVILLIGFVAWIFMMIIQLIGRFMVYATWGPLRYIFRDHQRSITLQALVINLVKYIVYFTALGYILLELGIDYRTYLASLSLIGIAIGFGSQGLVQDVVTGFFILFENQFVVGDMVEIAGQTGIVEDIGLRTTRLRNYLGGTMIFPNRNIAVVGRYEMGGMEVNVDVAVLKDVNVEEAGDLLQRIGNELAKQFDEIILDEPEIVGMVVLETGEQFLRLYGTIWPAQQWVIEAQLVPRIKELFKQKNIEIPGDRIAVFYHQPDKNEKVQTVLHRLRDMVRDVLD